jgi:hypothetical protein
MDRVALEWMQKVDPAVTVSRMTRDNGDDGILSGVWWGSIVDALRG